jgi:tetratricopeptide (TPR) repeat protein
MSQKAEKRAAEADTTAGRSGTAAVHNPWVVLGICIFLVAIVWIVFGQTLHHEFINYDDDVYVYRNPVVSQGLTLKGIAWAFNYGHMENWIPLSMISHMLDCQFYHLDPSGHHLTNVLFHATAVVLLFLVLRQMTGALWRSAFVAAVFAVHPLRVESVAWVAERKDVLSGVFFMLTICAYMHYARRPSPIRYGLLAFLFALGLMSKPMLVTVPLVLLLLDYWPLNRIDVIQPLGRMVSKRLLLEKLPLFALVVAASIATFFLQTKAASSFGAFSLPMRLGNALVSYVAYLQQMFWPSNLAVMYPMPRDGVPFWQVIVASVLLLSISIGVFALRKTRPYLLVGWLWYLVMMVPVIGIIQVGSQARADRYTYLPEIGLYMALVWGAIDLSSKWRRWQIVLAGSGLIILSALIICARTQVSYWRNSELLWNHTLACTPPNYIAEGNLAAALREQGRVDEAILHFQKAVQINPADAEAHYNLGATLHQKGSIDEVIAQFEQALQIDPDYAEAHDNLGNALFEKGNVDDAITHYQQGLRIKPDNANIHNNLGLALLQKGRLDEAIAQYEQALQIKSDYADAHNNLATALLKKGDITGAVSHFRQTVQFNPDNVNAQGMLAWLLATAPEASVRNGNEAVELAQRVNQSSGGANPAVLRVMAAAYAEAGRFDDAILTGQKARELAQAAGRMAIVQRLNEELKLYEAKQPFHQAKQ